MVDVAQLEFCIRDDLNTKAPRVMAVLDPIKVTIEIIMEVKKSKLLIFHMIYQKMVVEKIPFSNVVFIEREDFSENPVKGYNRLTLEQPVRLRHAYIITCKEVIKDASGNIVEIKAEYNPNSKVEMIQVVSK